MHSYEQIIASFVSSGKAVEHRSHLFFISSIDSFRAQSGTSDAETDKNAVGADSRANYSKVPVHSNSGLLPNGLRLAALVIEPLVAGGAPSRQMPLPIFWEIQDMPSYCVPALKQHWEVTLFRIASSENSG